ncbi:MAG: tetratricopeptide repeat protein [Thermoanaerobaculia bacterium]
MTDDRVDDHLDVETLRCFGDHELEREALFEVAWHLFLCGRCRALLPEAGPRAEALFGKMFGESRFQHDESSYTGVTRHVAEKFRRLGIQIERERTSAADLWRELEPHPPSRRRLLVENASRFATYGFAEYLLGECRRTWCEGPGTAEELAELALAVVYRLDRRIHGTALLNDLKAEAWSYIANCRRIRSDLRSVTEAFDLAEEFRVQGSGDLLEEAELLSLKASYYRDQRQFDEALQAVDRAIEIFREAGDRQGQGRGLVQRATTLRQAGDVEVAIDTLEHAATLVDASQEPRMQLLLHGNLVLYLSESGRGPEAKKLLPEVRHLATAVGGALDRIRASWLEGLVAMCCGHDTTAEAALRDAMEGFADQGIGYDAALVALDLAAFYLETNRTGQARELALEMIPIFTTRDVHREALAALSIVQRAMEEGAATVAMVQEAARYFRRARRNPALRFEFVQ